MTTRAVTARSNGQRTGGLFTELGTSTGHRSMRGGLYEDFLPNLRGNAAVRVWREMSDNDATVGSLLFAIDMLIRSVDWDVIPASEDPADLAAAEFLESCQDDMSHSWSDFISNVLTMLPYGWAWFETVYKRRTGPGGLSFLGIDGSQQKTPSSRFDDGRIGWRKQAYRPQESLVEFGIDDKGGVQAMIQAVGTARVPIPIIKSLWFRTTTARGNPTGRSILRTAYRSWFFKKRAEEIVMIGLERDLNGIPVAKIPADSILAKDKMYEEVKKIVTRIKQDEQQGLLWPHEYDELGNLLYEFDILSTSGRPKINGIELVRMFAVDILSTVLAEFLALGRDNVGSRALAEPKQELFRTSLEAYVTSIADVLNRHAVPRLFDLNTFGVDELPKFKPGEIADVDLAGLADWILKTSQAVPGLWGSGEAGDPFLTEARTLAGLEPPPDDFTADPVTGGVGFDPVTKRYLALPTLPTQ